MLKFRNAYVLIYKRKLTDDSLIIQDEAEAEKESTTETVMKSVS